MPAWSAASKPSERRTDPVGHVRDRRQDALAAVAGLVAVPQLDRLVDAGRGAGRHRRPAERAVLGDDVDLDGRVAPRVEDLPGIDPGDGGVAHLAASGSTVQEHRHARQLAALEELQRRAAAGADVGHLVGQPLLLDRRHRVAAPDDDRRRRPRRDPRGTGRSPWCRARTRGSRTRPAARSRARSGRPPAPPRCWPGSACRGRRCASWPAPSRRGSSCTRSRG